jgi:hypothetical protein
MKIVAMLAAGLLLGGCEDAGPPPEMGGADLGSPAPDLAPIGPIALPLSACDSGKYTFPVAVGGKSFDLVLDTGSATTAIAAASCSDCGVDPEYTPGSSAVDEKQTVQVNYVTGGWKGDIFQDSVQLGTASPFPVKLVAIDSQTSFFHGVGCTSPSGTYEGIVGFGRAALSPAGTDPMFDQLRATLGMPDVFAVRLCSDGGTLWVGGFDPSATTAAPTWVPLITAPPYGTRYYLVDLSSITVAGQTIPISAPNHTLTIVDTGDNAFSLPQSAMAALTDAVVAAPGLAQLFGDTSWFKNGYCANQTPDRAAIDAALPHVTLTFGSATLDLPPTQSYLTSYLGAWCPSLHAENASLPFAASLGVPVLGSNVIIFDRANQRLGFAPPVACPN